MKNCAMIKGRVNKSNREKWRNEHGYFSSRWCWYISAAITCVELLKEGYEVVVVDNLYNSSEEALKRVEQITGKSVKFYEADILDREALNKNLLMQRILIQLSTSQVLKSCW